MHNDYDDCPFDSGAELTARAEALCYSTDDSPDTDFAAEAAEVDGFDDGSFEAWVQLQEQSQAWSYGPWTDNDLLD